jgi:hypothetical protein
MSGSLRSYSAASSLTVGRREHLLEEDCRRNQTSRAPHRRQAETSLSGHGTLEIDGISRRYKKTADGLAIGRAQLHRKRASCFSLIIRRDFCRAAAIFYFRRSDRRSFVIPGLVERANHLERRPAVSLPLREPHIHPGPCPCPFAYVYDIVDLLRPAFPVFSRIVVNVDIPTGIGTENKVNDSLCHRAPLDRASESKWLSRLARAKAYNQENRWMRSIMVRSKCLNPVKRFPRRFRNFRQS